MSRESFLFLSSASSTVDETTALLVSVLLLSLDLPDEEDEDALLLLEDKLVDVLAPEEVVP